MLALAGSRRSVGRSTLRGRDVAARSYRRSYDQYHSAAPGASPARRVLLVEDNVAASKGMTKLLEAYGFEVTTAYDGASALEALATGRPPDFVLTDLQLPDLDGREVARQAPARAPPPRRADHRLGPRTGRRPLGRLGNRLGPDQARRHPGTDFEAPATARFGRLTVSLRGSSRARGPDAEAAMSFEIEQKFRTDGHSEVAARLSAMGAVASPSVEQEDTYLNHPSRDFAATNEAFRLRRVGGANAVTYKGPRHAGPTKTREEIEIPFADGAEAFERLGRMFELLGFRTVAVIRKTRTPYRVTHEGRAVEVVLDIAEGVGTFVEVETIAEGEADLPEAQRVVLSLADALGLREVEPRSYLRMALEHRAEPA